MAEYWKSTPNYWCKFCSTFVKDTKLERRQHEATGRHQGAIQRSLRSLHREQEQEQRNQQRAKSEIARLNGLVGSSSAGSSAALTTPESSEPKLTYTKREEKKATLEDRKKQWKQLAELGVMLPEEARQDLGIAGEWKVVSETVVGEVGEDGEFKPVNKGVHKRKLDDDEKEELEAAEMVTKKKGWGQTYKTFPGKGGAHTDDDVESLFKKKPATTDVKSDVKSEMKEEDGVKSEKVTTALSEIATEEEEAAAAKEKEPPAPTVVFKKRKKTAK